LRLLERPRPERFDAMGIGVSALSFQNAVETLLAAPHQGERIRVHFAAMHTLSEASKSEPMRHALDEADYVMPDGMPLVWLGRMRGMHLERVCGPDTMLAVLDRSRAPGYRHFFYGGRGDSLQRLSAAMTRRFPGLHIAGLYAPPFRPLTEQEKLDVAAKINKAAPDFVWVGLGSPKQDEWLATFRPLLDASVILAVGAAFDFHSGRLQRAPRWAQCTGFEWAFRLAAEPRRLAGRYAALGVCFARLFLNEATKPGKASTNAEW
jgi:N-acetylglucosaminyldiphosphoundecaprenol N-acetyl-beta-D-mannosaminyltransferase